MMEQVTMNRERVETGPQQGKPTGVGNSRGAWVAALILALPALLILLDFTRPVLLERELLNQVRASQISPEPLFGTSDFVVIGGACIILIGTCCLAVTGRRLVLAMAAFSVWSSVLVLGAGEWFATRNDRPYVYPPGMKAVFHPKTSIMPGINGPSHVSINTLGMRGPEWDAHAYRILAVGGSTTICLFLDDHETWPQLVMDNLNRTFQGGRRFWVGNVGKSGLDSVHHLSLLRTLPEARNVDLILILAGVNDFSRALRLPYSARIRLAPSQVYDLGGPARPLEPILKQTKLYRSARLLMGRYSSTELGVEDDTGQSYTTRRELRRKSRHDYPLPRLDTFLAEYRSNLSEMARLCRDRHTRCVFLTQPTMWQNPMPSELEALTWFLPIGSTGRTPSSPDLARGMAAFNQAMLDVCREESAECVDVAAVVPKDTSAFYDEEHFNEAGARVVAEAVTQYLVSTFTGRYRTATAHDDARHQNQSTNRLPID